MARPKEFDEEQALTAAMKVFWARGYAGTSLQELEQDTGLTRTSIYNTFGNKRKLFERAVEHYRQTELSRLAHHLQHEPTVREGIRKLLMKTIDLHFRADTPGGCLVVLSLLEREQHTPHSVRHLESIMQDFQTAVRKRIVQAQRTHELSGRLDAGALASNILVTMAGIMVMGKAGASRSMLKKVAVSTCQLLDG